MADDLDRLRSIALALPAVNERLSHGAPCFFVRDKRPLCYYHDEHFSDDGRRAIWCPAAPGAQEALIAAEPARYFRPQPSASGVFSTWLGIHLATTARGAPRLWADIAAVLEDAYRLVAPKALMAALDQQHTARS